LAAHGYAARKIDVGKTLGKQDSTMEGLGLRVDPQFWQGKTVLVTGHTGFKGAWLSFWLKSLGARVVGISLAPITTPNLFSLLQLGAHIESQFIDIRHRDPLSLAIKSARADIVFHLAAQALVRVSYENPVATFDSNVNGTSNVLDALRGESVTRVAVMITTDKVYKNLELQTAFAETDELGGHDPYSASKAAAELVVASYRDSYLRQQGLAVATARAGNVIGGGDWSADRLLPDCVRAWGLGQTVDIRMPGAVRPWQHVLDPLSGYLVLAQRLWDEPALASAFNFGPDAAAAATVRDAVVMAQKQWGLAKAPVVFHNLNHGPKEAHFLQLNTQRAHDILGVRTVWGLEDAIARTMGWYHRLAMGQSARDLCTQDLTAFQAAMA
jgi:CDP-glucose 4,6-dehydratase